MIRLGVNIDHVATLREVRKIDYPDPIFAAKIAEQAGASSIVCHLREDRRHIKDRDLKILRELIHIHLNLEMAALSEIQEIAVNVKPDTVTLVPERREELTTEGGLNVIKYKQTLSSFIAPFFETNINVSLFIEPDKKQIDAAKEIGVNTIELHTGTYAHARSKKDIEKEFSRIQECATYASSIGLEVACGHGLHYHNVQRLTQIKEIVEYNIGHSIIAKAIFVGLERAVRDMIKLLNQK